VPNDRLANDVRRNGTHSSGTFKAGVGRFKCASAYIHANNL